MPQSSSSQSKSADGVVKHRACDECRSRKLACTKEPDGCSRCKREGLRCVYSPQKQMGRPRKRRHVEESPEAQPSSIKPQDQAQQSQAPLITQPTLDTDFSAFLTQDFNVNYLDLLSPLDGPPSTLPPELASLNTMAYTEPRYPAGDFQFGVGGVDLY
ncbi:Lactose regulatory protein LAC9 [Colletotrichum fructicola Nara gc5]|uniref:Lactose regulatory protein LAC9 n=1 Tax=Colletotrichum fructicola (strain Nara gc5) TaxID=1213859 RepID=A0A7J6JPF6_COLFN|nr:Lactose regulatory protein LAC9 [Colletotrichum fructicola]KAF4491907.1 Lactose regulatory protein LAC9 [Colletotrichum fructicola Nara gc5]KAF5514954.1 Lactose regulatory protein LAC9 [Colletotrichum fructicola]